MSQQIALLEAISTQNRAVSLPLLRVWGGLRLLFPFTGGRKYLPAIAVWKTIVLGVSNFILMLPWLIVLQTCREWYLRHNSLLPMLRPMKLLSIPYSVPNLAPPASNDWMVLLKALVWADWQGFHQQPLLQTIPPVLVLYVTWLSCMAMLYFMLLPFAARPGSNRACALHVLKVSSLGTAAIHFIFAAMCLLTIIGTRRYLDLDLDGFTGLIKFMAVFCAIAIYGVAALAWAAKVDYRKPADLPKPHDPRCEACGYSLVMAPMEGRCPECGKPVAESLGGNFRPPTDWEKSPRWYSPRVVLKLAATMFFRPMAMFSHMPAYSGKAAVERWLVLSMCLVGCAAYLLWPLMQLTSEGREGLADPQVYIGAFVMASIWTGLALMMVGIETAGVATVAHMRGQHVDLGAAAKVTGYSGILMLFWIILGGIQLTIAYMFFNHPQWHFINPKLNSIVAVGTFSAAQIGGLLWYELTVYRGLSVVRFANH